MFRPIKIEGVLFVLFCCWIVAIDNFSMALKTDSCPVIKTTSVSTKYCFPLMLADKKEGKKNKPAPPPRTKPTRPAGAPVHTLS
jgi:hypothetical protein